MERVHGELGAGQPLRDDVGDPARPVRGDDLDGAPLHVGEPVEEVVQPPLAVPLAGPHDAPAAVVDDHRHVPVPPLVAGLVHPDAPQAVEPAAAVAGLQVGPDAGAYPAHGAPVDPHELGQRAPAHVQGEPRHGVLEGRGEPARRGAGPRDGLGAHPVFRALDAPRRVLDAAPGGADVRGPPPPGGERVVAVAPPAAGRAAERRPPGPRGDDYGFPLDSGALDDGGAEPEGPL